MVTTKLQVCRLYVGQGLHKDKADSDIQV